MPEDAPAPPPAPEPVPPAPPAPAKPAWKPWGRQRLRRIGEIYLTLAAAAGMLLLSWAFILAWPDGQLHIDMNRYGEYRFELALVLLTTAATLCFVPRDLKEEQQETDK